MAMIGKGTYSNNVRVKQNYKPVTDSVFLFVVMAPTSYTPIYVQL